MKHKKSNYEASYNGKRFNIPLFDNGRLYILFYEGYGSGDQSYYAEFFTKYKVLMSKDGDNFEEVGELSESIRGEQSSFGGTIKGEEIRMAARADDVFITIFPKDD